MRGGVRELACTVLGLGDEEEGLPALLAHILLVLEQVLHDFFELFLEGICLSLQQLVALLGGFDLLLVQLQVPT